jgi:DNA polymerase IV (DinB-like DNA polymerase)
MAQTRRIIFHLDMDHFYTAVEEREHPEIRGKPVVVGADPREGKGRGVVSTSNYEARKFGVRSGMPISRAWRLCPQCVYLPVNMTLYVKVSNEIMDIVHKYADKFEQWGIDEAFLDVTSKVKDYVEAENFAREIKRAIFGRESLTCSIGISFNKLLAKIASDVQKPDGLTTVKEQDAEKFLSPLPVRRLLGVGHKTGQFLESLGVKTIGDLARYDPAVLIEHFGVMGNALYSMAHGLDNSDVEERGEIKSIGRDVTFSEDTNDFQYVLRTLDVLAEDVYQEFLEQRACFKTVTVRIRYENFETHTHGKTLPFITDRLQDLEKTARELMQPYLKTDRKIRLIGVRVSNFVSGDKQRKLI